MNKMWLFAALAAVCFLLLWRRSHTPSRSPRKVVYAEQTFRSHSLKLVARLDQAYEEGEDLHLVELKTRSRHVVHQSDVIELSAQRIALMDETGRKVAMAATVVTQVREERVEHRVLLYDRDTIAKMLAARRRLLSGAQAPRYADRPALCRKCAHAGPCFAQRSRDR